MAGQAAIDRYAVHGVRIPSKKFKILGRPSDREHRNSDDPNLHRRQSGRAVRTDLVRRRLQEQPLIPSIGTAIVSALLARNATVIFRPHPARRKLPESAAAIAAIHKLLRADAKATQRATPWGAAAASDPTFAELANVADAMVADVSGVVTDFMQSLKPFAMVATGDKTDTFRARFPSSCSAYVIEWDLSTLDAALDAMLGADPLAATRSERRRYYLGGYDNGESARAFVGYLQSLTAPRPVKSARDLPLSSASPQAGRSCQKRLTSLCARSRQRACMPRRTSARRPGIHRRSFRPESRQGSRS